MGTTERDPGGGVFGFVIAFFAFAFGGALGLPSLVRLVVIGVGVVLAVRSAGMTGFGLAALVLGGGVLVSSITLFGALGASRYLPGTPPHPTVDRTTAPQEDGGYILTRLDNKLVETWWNGRPKGDQRATCAVIRDGVSDAEMPTFIRELVIQGIRFGREWQVRARAMLAHIAIKYCATVPVVVSLVDIPAGTDLNDLIEDDQFRIIAFPEAAVVDDAVTSVKQLRDGHNSVTILAGEQIPAGRIDGS
jgi:hypothetical protein